MKYLILIVAVQLLAGCTTMSVGDRLQAGADQGAWHLCNYTYPYVKGTAPGTQCDRLWDKFNKKD